MNVLLSIKPQFAEKILAGEKGYEFRKQGFKNADAVETILLYASSPVQKIVGYFRPGEVSEHEPQILWNRFGSESGLSRDRFMDYFTGAEKGCAIEVIDPVQFSTAVDPYKEFESFRPPVSFKYLNGEFDMILQ